MIALSGKVREKSGKGVSRRLRAAEMIPAVIYGKGSQETLISLSEKEIHRFIQAQGGAARPFDIELEGTDGNKFKQHVILHDFSKAMTKNKILHADFMTVNDNTTIKMEVPVVTVGESVGVKKGGVVQLIRHSILIKCLAKDIPPHIDVDISSLDFGTNIHVLDIKYPPGVKPIVSGRNFTLVTMSGSNKEEPAVETSAEAENEDAKAPEAKK